MAANTILVADDDRAIRTVLSEALGRLGHQVRTAGDAATLWRWVKDGAGDLVITDVVMPDENGLDLLPRIRKLRPDLRVIVMSARNTLLTAVKATEGGAFEYLAKPFDLGDLRNAVERALSRPKPVPANESAGDEEALPIVGRSPAMQEIYRLLARLMTSDLTVLLTGESGTGKELIARALHDYGRRRKGPFIAVNMAAIPRDLIESDLFGHERGAFTGAINKATGRFEQAAGGTLFLDEIGDMPLEAQTRLLRVLQEGEFTTVGGREPIRADLRIVAATHRDLREQVRRGQFREDLYYRLNVVPLRLPPLRERIEDIPDLVRHFLNRATEEGGSPKMFDAAAIERLQRYEWPGNVRELENLVRRVAVIYGEDVIGVDIVARELAAIANAATPSKPAGESLAMAAERHLRDYFSAHTHGLPARGLYDRVLREIERPLIQLSLEATRGNQIRAAEMLGLNRNTLRKKIRELDISVLRGLK
ncbi:MAG TPA: nitrogen regulation protein NR(I) [Hypericibacter adhaerens]|jgi:two-component system nitrogen regulation response regulator GlnG|uniref:DNA-binding transcriptional regulator NtrC n=1 Tax=Hypericibacter adhaerens TaxID=2602016 RepID=A0A5J6MXM1_9PROT|nr:nitrogen regulation protein NR(I) [Hypericibacter adhaerens]QEX22279.1 nitrogen regulation protein NR(I) [Hypericibacter adhaerens]HWA44456.1 nitrogen regulation protein NR(I) [Hypericibacter adhaerens]